MAPVGAGKGHVRIIGSVLGGRYRIVRPLGQGSMGAVYQATDPEGRAVAVKILSFAAATREIVARFVREARLTRTIDHPNVVSTLDAGEDSPTGAPFLVMPILAGRDLRATLRELGALEPAAAVRIAVHACRGLGAAHDAGVVHRDIKPSNIFLEQRGAELVAKVLDFGVAKSSQASDESFATDTGDALGSPLYMSPEQIRSSKHVDGRSDVFSLGAVLFQMLAGRVPYQGDSPAEIMVSICARRAPRIQDVAPWIGPDLAAVVDQALERRPESRYPSARAFERALLPFTGGSDRLTSADLAAVSAAKRALVAPRADDRPVESEPPTIDLLSQSRREEPEISRLGDYRVLRSLGSGGMGTVYEVELPGGRVAAAKVISAKMANSSTAVRRLIREARAAAVIQSPHVARVVDVAADDKTGLPFLVMERLQGVDLATVIRDAAPLEPVPAVRAFIQAARGLSAAHALGIVHRDVKPSNLFVHAPDGGAAIVKVCDFGIAKRTSDDEETTSQDLTETGGMLGSPRYMSPEQAKNAKGADHRTDVWSLCISLYEALGGRRPWEGRSSVGELIVAICTEPLPPLSSIAPWIDPGLAEVVHRGLERDPSARWSRMDDVILALQPYAGGGERLDAMNLARVDPSEARHAMWAGRASRPSLVGDQAVSVTFAEEPRAGARRRSSRLVLGLAAAASLGAVVTLGVRRFANEPSDRALEIAVTAAPSVAEPAPPPSSAETAAAVPEPTAVAAAPPPVPVPDSAADPVSSPASARIAVPPGSPPRGAPKVGKTSPAPSSEPAAAPAPPTPPSAAPTVAHPTQTPPAVVPAQPTASPTTFRAKDL